MRQFHHLDLQERQIIEDKLNKKSSISSIARELGRSTTTITNEIKNNFQTLKTNGFCSIYNNCSKRKVCYKKHVCGKISCRKQRCSSCDMGCNEFCDEFEEYVCLKKSNPPYVCNGCYRYSQCGFEKRVYKAKKANKAYREFMSLGRQGINLDEDEMLRIEGLIAPLILNGHSVYHAYETYKDELMVSSKTLYNWINGGVFKSIKRIDLPRAVKYKKRDTKKETLKIDRQCRIGRTYKDFFHFLKDEDLDKNNAVQLDTVKGGISGKCLLTIAFPYSSFMLIFLRDANTSQSVIDIFNKLERLLGIDDFKKLFPACLTDNGSEFTNPTMIECSPSGELRTNVFYCNPNASWEKGFIENNHEFIRKISSKGKSFNDLTQDDVDNIQNHINSYKRAKLNGKSPYEAFESFYGSEILKKLGAKQIDPTEIILHPNLIK